MSTAPQRSELRAGHDRKYRVLVVEDAPDTREFLRLLFEREGYEVLLAADGVSGVTTAIRELPDAILMDMSLPGLDGYNAARLIRREPALAGVPLIACTAFNRWEWRGKAIAAGFDAFITKPLDVNRLASTLAALLADRAGR
ncbi:MAG TPA: response regulator [Pyrinomonadaceae bacterium]|jgi:CheY-like chemotaxis protein|nr:response regulator [Pyrinomonadaceae bacterium]